MLKLYTFLFLVFLFLQDHLFSSQLFVLKVFVFVLAKHWVCVETLTRVKASY